MKLFLLLFVSVITFNSFAQEAVYRHSVSGEIGGLGVAISVQYDYMFKNSVKGFYDARAGIGGFYSDAQNYISIPHALTYNFGREHHYLETGIGGTIGNEFNKNGTTGQRMKYFIGPMIGYRSISLKGFQFRIYANIFFYTEGVLPLVGMGFGKAFRKKH